MGKNDVKNPLKAILKITKDALNDKSKPTEGTYPMFLATMSAIKLGLNLNVIKTGNLENDRHRPNAAWLLNGRVLYSWYPRGGVLYHEQKDTRTKKILECFHGKMPHPFEDGGKEGEERSSDDAKNLDDDKDGGAGK